MTVALVLGQPASMDKTGVLHSKFADDLKRLPWSWLCSISGALMFSLICAWINGWVDNRMAGDLRHHCAHYYVTVMSLRQYLAHILGGFGTLKIRWFAASWKKRGQRTIRNLGFGRYKNASCKKLEHTNNYQYPSNKDLQRWKHTCLYVLLYNVLRKRGHDTAKRSCYSRFASWVTNQKLSTN